MKSSDKIRILL